MKKNNYTMILITFVISFLLVSVANAEETTPSQGDWWGNVFVDSAQVNDTSVVEAFRSSDTDFTSPFASSVVGAINASYYLIHVNDPAGEQIYFKVDGVNASALQTWSVGNHDMLNLSMSKLASGATCTYANACNTTYCCDTSSYTNCNGDCTGTCSNSCTAPTTTGGGGGGGTTALTTVIPFTTQGITISLAKNSIAKFIFDSAYHTIKVIKVGADYVILEIASDPVTVTLNLLESKKLDLNNDNYYDLYVKLNEIKSSKADLEVKYIHEIITPVVTPPAKEEEEEQPEEVPEETPEEEPKEEVPPEEKEILTAKTKTAIIIVLVIALLALVGLLVYRRKKGY